MNELARRAFLGQSAPLASMDCSITADLSTLDKQGPSRQYGSKIVDVPTLSRYFDYDQLSELADGSLFEITASGCLSKSVFSAGKLVSSDGQPKQACCKRSNAEMRDQERQEARKMMAKIEPYDYSSTGSLTAQVIGARRVAATASYRRPANYSHRPVIPSGSTGEALGAESQAKQGKSISSSSEKHSSDCQRRSQSSSAISRLGSDANYDVDEDEDDELEISHHKRQDQDSKASKSKKSSLLGLFNLFNLFDGDDSELQNKESLDTRPSIEAAPKDQAVVRPKGRKQTARRRSNQAGIKSRDSIKVTNRRKVSRDKPVELLLGTVSGRIEQTLDEQPVGPAQAGPSGPRKLKSVKFTMPNEVQ